MGLDMYLSGVQHFDYEHRPIKGGFPVKSETVELGYWRKHPNLHGFIVQNFAQGLDNCQDVSLSADDIRTIINSSEADALPETTGFFFGVSQPEDKAATKLIFERALHWLAEEEEGIFWKEVIYRASW